MLALLLSDPIDLNVSNWGLEYCYDKEVIEPGYPIVWTAVQQWVGFNVLTLDPTMRSFQCSEPYSNNKKLSMSENNPIS